jgi:ubiquinone/menaquinone biosynthesis C-methylase UbiE
MIDIQKIICLAIKKAEQLEKLPLFSETDASTIDKLRKRNYPSNRNMNDYLQSLPLLESLLSKKAAILDIGTGNGIALQKIHQKYDCDVTGTGISAIDNDKIKFVIAEASSLPFHDNSFDIVISVHGISWAPNQNKAIEEAIRVLKPNNYCLIELIKFSASVDIWYGDEFWNEIGIKKYEYMLQYDFDINITFPYVDMKITKISVPKKQYKEKYYLEIYKKKIPAT